MTIIRCCAILEILMGTPIYSHRSISAADQPNISRNRLVELHPTCDIGRVFMGRQRELVRLFRHPKEWRNSLTWMNRLGSQLVELPAALKLHQLSFSQLEVNAVGTSGLYRYGLVAEGAGGGAITP